jgi:hypothetical protein
MLRARGRCGPPNGKRPSSHLADPGCSRFIQTRKTAAPSIQGSTIAELIHFTIEHGLVEL